MRRRELLKYAAATAVAGSFGPRIARAADPVVVKVGVVGPKTGPLAPGAAVTHFPNFKLWAYEVNQRGGLKLKDGLHKVELIEYDDRTQPPEAIKAVERLATVDKVDFIMPVYATGFNLAVAPIFAKYNYPLITQACVTDQIEPLTKRYPNMFFVVPEAEIDVFSGAVARLESPADYRQLVDRFGVRRSNEKFWSVYDAINSIHLGSDPVRSGTLDLTRYTIEEK